MEKYNVMWRRGVDAEVFAAFFSVVVRGGSPGTVLRIFVAFGVRSDLDATDVLSLFYFVFQQYSLYYLVSLYTAVDMLVFYEVPKYIYIYIFIKSFVL